MSISNSRPGTPATGVGSAQAHAQALKEGKPFVLAPSPDIHQLTGPNASVALFNLNLPISQSLAMTSSKALDASTSSAAGVPLRIGNLVLSSCPGKKVRVTDTHLALLNISQICRPAPQNQQPLVDPRSLPGAAVTAQFQLNRSPICRDIELDLKKAMGDGEVKAVVCCLDDAELQFLGASWIEYERVARELNLEVIRCVSFFMFPFPLMIEEMC